MQFNFQFQKLPVTRKANNISQKKCKCTAKLLQYVCVEKKGRTGEKINRKSFAFNICRFCISIHCVFLLLLLLLLLLLRMMPLLYAIGRRIISFVSLDLTIRKYCCTMCAHSWKPVKTIWDLLFPFGWRKKNNHGQICEFPPNGLLEFVLYG